jgi:hypothetical protein
VYIAGEFDPSSRVEVDSQPNDGANQRWNRKDSRWESPIENKQTTMTRSDRGMVSTQQ